MTTPPLLEGFFAVRFKGCKVRIRPIEEPEHRALEHKVAEVAVPLKTDQGVYGMVAMLEDLPADALAVAEAVALQKLMPEITERFRDHFKPVADSAGRPGDAAPGFVAASLDGASFWTGEEWTRRQETARRFSTEEATTLFSRREEVPGDPPQPFQLLPADAPAQDVSRFMDLLEGGSTSESNPTSMEPPPGSSTMVEVHNVWTIYGMNPDGSVSREQTAVSSRPQDWGSPRYHYERFRFEWTLDEVTYVNHCHCWTDLQLERGDYPRLFAGLVVLIMQPGRPEELCGRSHLAEDDFWDEAWGKMPPIFFGADDDDGDEAGWGV